MSQNVYVIIESEDIELRAVHLRSSLKSANRLFDKLCKESGETDNDQLEKEVEGTLRLAGDDAYSIQLLERPIK